MIGRLLDKLVFGAALILALQVPQLADHYHQFLSGLYESTKWQVDGYQATAREYGYPSVRALVEHHMQNDVASVRKDALQKLATLDQYEHLQAGMAVFENGNLLSQTMYMLHPERYRYLEKVVSNFDPGVPLTLGGWTFGVVVGLLINTVLTLPFALWTRRRMVGRSSKQKTLTGTSS